MTSVQPTGTSDRSSVKSSAVEAPGPGVWELDCSHFARPLTRFMRDLWPDAFQAGQASWMERYGMPLRTIQVRTVDGFPYVQPVPLSGPVDAKPPPAWLFGIITRVMPSMRACRRKAERAAADKIWRADAQRWTDELWPDLQRRYLALQEEELAPLDDEGLIDHIARATQASSDSAKAHFSVNGATMIPSGMLIAFVRSCTDADAADVMAEVKADAPGKIQERALLDALVDALEASDLEGEPAAVIEALETRDDDTGDKARAWLARVKHRQIWGGDLYFPTGIEMPHLLVEQLRSHDPASPVSTPPPGTLRARIPAALRDRYDALLAEACATVYLRDERSSMNDGWSLGLLRRALLEAGKRLATRGALQQADHAIHLTMDECTSLLRGGDGPSAEEVARHARQQTLSSDDMPQHLGGDPMPPPPVEAFPGVLGDMLSGLFAYVETMEGDKSREQRAELRGTPASAGSYVGVARVVIGPEDFGRVRPGDVLVARATMPSYNGALAIAGAVVTDRGGALSHAAIVSRELGIPSVVGTRHATKQIPDGARVRVDGDTGKVEVLA